MKKCIFKTVKKPHSSDIDSQQTASSTIISELKIFLQILGNHLNTCKN